MSYVLTGYAIDLDRLRSAVGSKDASLIEAVRAAEPRDFDRALGGGTLTMGQALARLVMGEPMNREDAHQYGYALQALCGHLGQTLLPDAWGGVRWAAMEETHVDEVLESGPPVELPPIRDFPGIGYLEADEVRERVEALGDEGLSDPDEDLDELLKEFEEWLRTAAAANKGLVLFYA